MLKGLPMQPDARPLTVDVAGAPVGSLFLRVVRLHRLLATTLLDRIGLAPPQELILLYLHEHGARQVPQRDIVLYLGRDRSTVTNSLQAMERSGLISRRKATVDRRMLLVSLSRKGSELVPRVKQAWSVLEQMTLEPISAIQRRQLAATLRAIETELLRSITITST